MARSTATATAARRPTRVEDARRRAAARRRAELEVVARPSRRITPTAVLVALFAAGVAFTALSVQISLIHRQQQLDAVRSEITDLQLANKELRQKESRLQAPAEVLRIARDELGMVEAKPAELVTPATEVVGIAPTTGPQS
ncbi:MAG TPA: septum formation initiator family protein [Microthrixaceae bacterium]|nr:septum formation initiator family protein [Microthrixaceae bacterium]HNI34574.1 septum formation initiator family protein [Microthrixaceae bacterium]